MTFPAHHGLILPVMSRWSDSFDALALSMGAGMPDVTDTVVFLGLLETLQRAYGRLACLIVPDIKLFLLAAGDVQLKPL
jgi:hypothetical protein